MNLALNGLPNSVAELAHAYIIEGKDNVKRRQQAELLGKILLCQSLSQDSDLAQSEPCGSCHSCHLFEANSHPDFLISDPEQNSIGVDEIRNTSLFLTKMSQLSGAQVVILDKANSMTESASNALLKTLEEPTNKSFLLLLVDNKSQLMPTILSRCQFINVEQPNKQQLKQKYSDLPDYIIGFGQFSESDIQHWISSGKIDVFEQNYQNFISWLKRQKSTTDFASEVVKDEELQSFILYLLQRRVRQLMLKHANSKVLSAEQALNQFHKLKQTITGLNSPLAFHSLLVQLTDQVR